MRPGASDGRKNGTTRRIYERAAFIQRKSSGAYEVFQSAVNQTDLLSLQYGKAHPRQHLWKRYIMD